MAAKDLLFIQNLAGNHRIPFTPKSPGSLFSCIMAMMFARLLSALLILSLLVACGARTIEKSVVVEVDGQRIQRLTSADTIAEALSEAHVVLGPLDRVSPDLNDPTDRSTRIVVTRIREDTLTEQRVVPFPRTYLRDEGLADGQSRVIQLGVNGHEELSYKVVYENGAEYSRDLVTTRTIELPREEIVLVGAKGLLKSAPIAGTIFYLSNGNAWLMRETSGAKRPLTFTGDLDGRVFAPSPDGSRVIFTRRASVGGAVGAVGPLNALWQVETRFTSDTASPAGLDNILYADWYSNSQIIYSTGERTAGAPGWKANNDLWLYDTASKLKQQLLAPMTTFAYAFWGVTFALSPDHRQVAYAGADEIGFVDLASGKRIPLQSLPVYETNAGWVWIPDITWSPDMRFVAATLHSPPPRTPDPEAAPVFGIWAINAAGGYAAQLVPDSGMFANPVWSKQGRIAYAQARLPQQSADSQYDLWVMNVDGSSKQRIFPEQGEVGIVNPQAVWSGDGSQILVLQEGNIYLVNAGGKGAVQLTGDGGGTAVRWR